MGFIPYSGIKRFLPWAPTILAVLMAASLLVFEQSKKDDKDYWAPYVLIALGLIFAFNLQTNVTRVLSSGRSRESASAPRPHDGRLDALWEGILGDLSGLDQVRRVQARLVMDQGIRSLQRLDKSTVALVTRGNLNLSVGIVLGVSGLLIIGSLSFLAPISVSTWQGLVALVPRSGMAILVEGLAFFFLKLYKNSLDDSRYVQNEVTTLEAKLLAAFISVFSTSDTLSDAVARGLLATERNAILNRDQTQAWLERARMESDATQKTMSQLSDLVGKIRGQKPATSAP